ncbi:hypothetical protein SO3561_06287 [Streptomyces olivochromogenes]|uniref:Uncharacterized protein n=1 Tax=Streptomyces olivochromogenes TaxID=1963 RepID=A0A250VKW7_STROL|nr:hypothetical protein SO3561_06287 [Streptomyces olivochromogenes]
MNVAPHDPTLQARVPKWMADETTCLANLQGVPISEVIRQALRAHLEKHNINPPGYVGTPSK